MKAISRGAWAAYGLALAIVLLDQISKSLVTDFLRGLGSGPAPALGPLKLTLVLNGGVSFGLLQVAGSWGRWVLALFELAVVLVLAVWVRGAGRWLSVVAVAMIMGGAAGNALDRFRLGYVVDFVDAQGLFFPWVFNVADSAISVGVALLLLESVLLPSKTET